MLTGSQLFALGQTVPVIGIHFQAALLLDRAQDGSPPAAARARELLGTFEARKPGVIANVRRTEALLAALGGSAGAPPRMPAEFAVWAGRVLEEVEGKLGADRVGLATFHLVGRLCGEALATLNLAIYALALGEAAEPADASWLEPELAQDRDGLDRLARALRGAAAIVPAPAASGLTGLADALATEPLGGVAEAQTAMKHCAELVTQVEAALAAME